MNWQAFWLGSYDPATERFNLTHDALNWIDIGGGGGGFSGGAGGNSQCAPRALLRLCVCCGAHSRNVRAWWCAPRRHAYS